MDPEALAQKVQAAFEAGDWDTVLSYMTDDFQADGVGFAQPLGAQEWLVVSKALRGGFPDISYNFEIESVEGDVVRSSTQITGTHTGDLDLSPLGMGVIPATGRSISAPREVNESVAAGDKFKSIYFHTPEEGGLRGILGQIGAERSG
jgi:hypothetical protein